MVVVIVLCYVRDWCAKAFKGKKQKVKYSPPRNSTASSRGIFHLSIVITLTDWLPATWQKQLMCIPAIHGDPSGDSILQELSFPWQHPDANVTWYPFPCLMRNPTASNPFKRQNRKHCLIQCVFSFFPVLSYTHQVLRQGAGSWIPWFEPICSSGFTPAI